MMAISETDRIALNALADDELDAAGAGSLKARLATDAALRATYDEIVTTRAVMAKVTRPEVSDDLLRRVQALALAADRPRRSPAATDWRRLAASIAVTAIAASSATYLLLPRGPSLEEFAAAGHRRSLLAQTPVDVASSDRHTVKPWLDAKLGVSPPAPDLASAGYPLLGGRVDVLGQAVAPTLVYRHNEHTMSLFARPGATGSTGERQLSSGGYNMIEWGANGFSFAAVSDLEPSELALFVQAYRRAAGT
jgi:anti-sigma factor RsiW